MTEAAVAQTPATETRPELSTVAMAAFEVDQVARSVTKAAPSAVVTVTSTVPS